MLKDEIVKKIEQAGHFMMVLRLQVFSSKWVDKEIKHALKVQKGLPDGCKVIPILLDGIQRLALHHWFGKKNRQHAPR